MHVQRYINMTPQMNNQEKETLYDYKRVRHNTEIRHENTKEYLRVHAS